MKYRIKQKNNLYYPQYRSMLLFWSYFYTERGYEGYRDELSFTSLLQAAEYLKSIIASEKNNPENNKEKIWYSEDLSNWRSSNGKWVEWRKE